MELIYVYDKLPDDLTENGASLIDWSDAPEITRIINQQYSFYGNYSIGGQNRKLIKKGSWIKALWSDLTWQYFKIKTVYKTLDGISITATHLGYEANRNFIQLSYTDRGNGKQIMANLKENQQFQQKFVFDSTVSTSHQFTAKEVNTIDAIIGQNNGNQNLVGVTGGELDMDNYNLVLRDRIGQDNGYRIDLGVNLESIKETADDLSVVNSLYLIGGVPEDTDYDKDQDPITYGFLEVEGVTDENRQIARRENSECVTEEELKKWGQTLFDNDRIHEPKVTHEVNMINLENTEEYKHLYSEIAKLNFGDTAYCDIELNDIKGVKERMIECVWLPTLTKYKNVVLGNDMGMYTSSVNSTMNEVVKKLETRSTELQNAIVNATQWITGTKGGYVRFRPKNAPEEILIMDRPKASEAKKVWRWNLGGLGYSNKGVDGPFETAITQDGAVVANFITVGIIRSDVFENSFNKTGDTLKLINGLLRIENNKIKIMELTKQGMEFWNGSQRVGTMGTKGNPFPGAMAGDKPLVTDGNSILITTTGGNDRIIGLSARESNGIAISEREIAFMGKRFSFFNSEDIGGPSVAQFKELHVTGKLIVNGKEITPGSGGSSGGDWNGQYPPEVTTQAEKFAWEAWVTLLSLGYSKAAAAGILGNINGEAGPSMNPDTEQVGGPAYGAVQFDGSSYPLIGAPTNNGREYFKRLHEASGAGGDYRQMSPQMKVVNWGMTNGQWLGAVNPTSVSGFKAMTSPEQAAYVFEKNYERPKNDHSERQGYARKWYDKFVNLQIVSNNWTKPLRAPYVVTQEWDEIGWGTSVIHGGIDLAPTGGGNPPIYAAKGGTVETATFDGTGGNYVVINHGDGYWTYYGHMTGINVSVGQKVDTNTVLGPCGMTGLASGVHLHFEVWKGGRWQRVNPRSVINF